MRCSCDIDPCVDNIKTYFYNRQKVIAIIDHKCDECGRTVPPDEEYELVYGNWGGAVATIHTCVDCLNLRNIFFPHSYYYEQLWEMFEDEVNSWDYQIPESCMVKLSKINFNKICDLIEEGWNHLESIGR